MKLLIFSLIAMLCASCTASKNIEPEDLSKVKIGLVLDKGGKDDKSFNTAAMVGATRAQKELGIDLKVVESPDDTSYEPALRTLALRGYKLVIGIGFSQADSVKKVAAMMKNTHFAIVDSVVEGPNVASLMFNEHEGSFIVGYISGLMTKTNKIGFVGGMEIDLIKRFELGFREGITYANKNAGLMVNYTGVTAEAWINPTKGKELALSQISKGADIIFTAAGATNMGVFDAVAEKNKLAIGVDSNQNWVKPGHILTSMLKRVDLAIYNTIKAEKENTLQMGVKYFGLSDKGIDYAIDQYNEKILPVDIRQKADKIKAEIISGNIKVPDYYVTRKLCPNSPLKCEKFLKPTGNLEPTTR